ncbi:MAG: FecCD family ABC transporter permease [Eubacteriales bacterium]
MIQLLRKNLIVIVIFLILVTMFVCITIGIADVSIKQTIQVLISKITGNEVPSGIKDSTAAIIWTLRFPRVLLAFLVGGALSICGVAYQGIFKNPMADPFIIGVSSGAALGATIGIVLNISFNFFGINLVTILAFIGALATIFLVYNISRVGKKVPVSTLLLSGVAVSQLLLSIVSLFMVFSDSLHKIIYWTMGSFNAKSWNHLVVVLPYVIIGFIILYLVSREMDIMLLGEDTASQLGVNTEKLKMTILITTAFLIASTVSVTGIIGFVGLIIPHVVRILVGPKHAKLLPYSFFIGGIFMIICDTISRSLISQEIPVGIVTSIFGGPFFIYLLKRKKSGGM